MISVTDACASLVVSQSMKTVAHCSEEQWYNWACAADREPRIAAYDYGV
jgi:hypothetical protein